MSYPAVRKEIAEGLAAKIKETFPEVEVIAGTATAGFHMRMGSRYFRITNGLYPQ